jgi:hypothetical protein
VCAIRKRQRHNRDFRSVTHGHRTRFRQHGSPHQPKRQGGSSGWRPSPICPIHVLIVVQRGTTVSITGLFTPLPVRRKEFERHAKREFSKALHLLMAYALVPCTRENNGVVLTVSNTPDGGCVSSCMLIGCGMCGSQRSLCQKEDCAAPYRRRQVNSCLRRRTLGPKTARESC